MVPSHLARRGFSGLPRYMTTVARTAAYDGVPAVEAPMTYVARGWKDNNPHTNLSLPLIRQVCGDDASTQTPITRSDALRNEGIYVDKRMPVYDARSLHKPLTVAENNIQVVPVDFHLERPRDNTFVRDEYVPRVLAMMKELLGAKENFAMTPLLRGLDDEGGPSWGAKFYTNFAHNDFAPLVEWENAHAWSEPWKRVAGKHFSICNVWHPLDPTPIQDQHLALVDPGTTVRDEFVMFETEGAMKNDALRLVHSEDHRWVYYPGMHCGEALIFQQYDTRKEDPAQWGAFHNTMSDSTAPPGAPKRRSVEMRVVSIFDDDHDAERRARFTNYFPAVSADWQDLDAPYLWHTHANEMDGIKATAT